MAAAARLSHPSDQPIGMSHAKKIMRVRVVIVTAGLIMKQSVSEIPAMLNPCVTQNHLGADCSI